MRRRRERLFYGDPIFFWRGRPLFRWRHPHWNDGKTWWTRRPM